MGIGIRLEGIASAARRALAGDVHDSHTPRAPAPPPPPPRHGSADTLERLARDGTQQRVLAKAGAPVYGPPAPRRQSGDELAQRYAPVLILPPGQYNLPADPQAFIRNSRLMVDWQGLKIPLADNTNASRRDDFPPGRVAAASGSMYLDLDNDQRGQLGDKDAPIFYQVDNAQNPTKITYWFFYAYNDGPSAQNHEGDFERITIELDPATQQPTQANYSAHNNSNTQPTAWQDVRLDEATGRPLVFVAGGSHASYAVPGRHPTEAHAMLPGLPTLVLGDKTATDTNRDGLVGEADGAVRIDTADQLQDVEQQTWYPSVGAGPRWGEDGFIESTSGPRGPSTEKGHFDLPPPVAETGPPTGTTTTTAPTTTPRPAPRQPSPQPQQPPTGTTTTTTTTTTTLPP